MSVVGSFALMLALFVSVYSLIAIFLGMRTRKPGWMRSGRNAVFAVTGLLTLAGAVLLYAFATHNFHIQYVAEHSSKSLSLIYLISAFWAGQEGSLLLWEWGIALCIAIVVIQNRGRNRELMPYVLVTMVGISIFFLVVLIFLTNPFRTLSFIPSDGMGLNPLLQNPGMVFHPPTIYVSYVGFTVPFAFAMAALMTGRVGNTWIRATRRWVLFSWLFLSIGNLLGAQWAYMELGWGGYWAWDPVENASLIPWLTATAYLHSVMIQERRGMLKVWNMVLIMLTFVLIIFGTFIVRSGILSSVHSFALSPVLGAVFLAFIGAILFFFFALLTSKWHLLRSDNELDSFLSRESTFLFNNLILIGAAFAIFWGTIFPLVSEAVRGVKVTVGPPFYNQIMVPIGLALLLLTGICPLISWRRASGRNLKKNFLYPFIITAIGGAAIAPWTIHHPYALTSFTLVIFVAATVAIEFFRGTKTRKRMTKEGYLKSFFTLILRNRRRYGGYIVHLGIVCLFVGITGSSAFKVEKVESLRKGESLTIKSYQLTFEDFSSYPTEGRYVNSATLSLYQEGKKIGVLRPEKNFYQNQDQPVTEAAVRSTLREDLYVVLSQYSEDGLATFSVVISPLIMWMWLGGFILVAGTILAMWPDKRDRLRLSVDYLGESSGEKLGQLLLQKESTYLNLKELEFDYRMGKLSQSDYDRARSRLERMALVLLEKIDQLKQQKERGKEIKEEKEEIEIEIEQEVLKMRQAKTLEETEKND